MKKKKLGIRKNRKNCKKQKEFVRNSKNRKNCKLPDSAELLKILKKYKRGKLEVKKDLSERYTSWELLNFILRGLVNQLVELGVPSSIKRTVLQLWTYYLRKIEVAFVCENDITALPKLSANFKMSDIEQLYGLKKIHGKAKKSEVAADEKTKKSEDATNLTEPHFQDWRSVAMKKHLQRKIKKKTLQTVVGMSIVSNHSSDTSFSKPQETNNMENESQIITPNSVEGNPIKRLKKIHFNSIARGIMEQKNCTEYDLLGYSAISSCFVPNKYKLLIILYLALLYERCDVHVSDLIRWIREGHLFYHNISHFLPKDCSTAYQKGKNCGLWNDYGMFLKQSNKMCRFVGMIHWPMPDWSKMVCKYVKELQLPTIFGDLLVKAIHFDLKMFCQKSIDSIPNYEGRVLALLIIIMKILFGLDGKTEHKISKVASEWNSYFNQVKNGKPKQLFVWNEWVQKIVCRDAILTKYHFPSKQVISPSTCPNPESFINHWRKWKDLYASRNNEHKFSRHFLYDVKPALVEYLDTVLDHINESDHLIEKRIDFPPCLRPYSVYTRTILKKCKESEFILDSEAKVVLSEKFTKRDINYILNPDWFNEQAKKKDICVKVIPKSAQKTFLRHEGEKQVHIDFRTHKCLVGVTHCSGKTKRMLKGRNVKESFQFSITRPETASCIRKIMNKMYMSLMNPKRKRKKSRVVERSKKMKKDVKKNKSNILKLNLPCSQYWILHDENCMTEKSFDSLLIKFPFSFSWLLSECALVCEMSKCVLYKEVVYLENAYKNLFLTSTKNANIYI